MSDDLARQEKPIEFYGGLFGAILPLILFILSVIYVTSKGMITMAAYFGPLVLVVGVVILLAKDRNAACEAMLAGLSDKTVAVMLFSFFGAGVLGQLLVSSGAVKAVVWLGYVSGVRGTLFVLLTFIITAIIASATGTSTGTCVTSVPILYPAGVVLGANPALLLGAIYSGARFGDNIAPISDTTIASALTQGCPLGDAVRTRLKYAFAAAGFAMILYVVASSLMGSGPGADGADLANMLEGYAKPQALPMLLAPVITIVLCLKGRSLIEALWFGVLGGIVIGLGSGSLTVADLYSISAPKEVGGALTNGVLGMRDVCFLIIFTMAILGALREAGVLDALIRWMMRFATTPKKAEFAIFALVSIMYPLCATNTPAMVLSGPMVKEIGEEYGISPCRRANLMDMAANGITGSLPHINTILALAGAMIATHESLGAPLVSLPLVGLLAFHPMMLTIVAIFAIATGWGAQES